MRNRWRTSAAKLKGRRRQIDESRPDPQSDHDYDVGYSRPPTHSRWKSGTSGNPRGRPKKSKNMKTIARDTLNGSVVLNEGGNRRRISYLEAILRKQIESALKGNDKAAFVVIKICTHLGLLDEFEDKGEPQISKLEEEMLNEILEKFGPKRTL
jgi:hypothetical protein